MTQNIFLSCPNHCDKGLILIIVYFFWIWNKKEHNVIFSWVISSHIGPKYVESPYIYIIQTNESDYIIPHNSWADVVRLLAERYDTMSYEKLGGFRSLLPASYVSSHTEVLWYNKTVCLLMTIYIIGWKGFKSNNRVVMKATFNSKD